MTAKKKIPSKPEPRPRKDYRVDAADLISGLAGGFMAHAMSNLSANLERKASLLSIIVHPDHRIEVKGKWIEKLRTVPGFGWLVQLISPLRYFQHNPAFDLGLATHLDIDRQGKVSVSREYDMRSKFPDTRMKRIIREQYGVGPDSPEEIAKRWGSRRFCFCPKKHDNAAHDKFCAYCGGSLEPAKPTDSGGRKLPHPMAWYCQHIKPNKPYMICVAKKGHEGKHFNGSFTWENDR